MTIKKPDLKQPSKFHPYDLWLTAGEAGWKIRVRDFVSRYSKRCEVFYAHVSCNGRPKGYEEISDNIIYAFNKRYFDQRAEFCETSTRFKSMPADPYRIAIVIYDQNWLDDVPLSSL